MAGLVLPKLTCDRRFLRMTFEAGHKHTRPVLRSDWSEGIYPSSQPGAYDGPTNDTDLWVSGIAAIPTVAAGWVVAWFVRRLARPAVRVDQGASGPGSGLPGRGRKSAVVDWYVTEPEQFLDARGTFGRWRLTRPPPAREPHNVLRTPAAPR